LQDVAWSNYTPAIFLDSQHLLMVYGSDSPERDTPPAIELHVFGIKLEDVDGSTPSATLTHLRTYETPKVAQNVRIREVACWCDVRGPDSSTKKKFSIAKNSSIVTLHYEILPPSTRRFHCTLIFPRTALYPPPTVSDGGEHILKTAPERVSWYKWGLNNVIWRFGDRHGSYHRPVASAGRFLTAKEDAQETIQLLLMETNRAEGVDESRCDWEDDRTFDQYAAQFSNPEEIRKNNLPYRVRPVEILSLAHTGWKMIDDERIVYQSPLRVSSRCAGLTFGNHTCFSQDTVEDGFMMWRYQLHVLTF
jgi:hypothetical protein